MTRGPVVLLVLAGVALVLAVDLATSEPLNPYRAPPVLALGSGLAAGGAHCSAPGT